MDNQNFSLKQKTLSGLIWKFMERIGAQLVTFIVSLILARLLMPDDYGIVAIVLVFINLANTLVVNGFGSSLVQKKDADNVDFSSVFYFNIVFSMLIYVFLFLVAPWIASFYGKPILCMVLRVLALRIPIAGVNSIQQAYVSRTMQFKCFFYSTLGGTLASAVIGILMAFMGCGVWALVAQYLVNSVTDTIVLWFTVRWRPERVFSYARMKGLFQYGWKILVSGLLSSSNNQLSDMIIGKVFSSSMLAYYNNGYKIPQLLVTNVNSSISSVLFPVLSAEQSQPEKVKAHTRKAIQVSSYIIWPMMFGLAVCAEPLIHILLTDKWLPSVFFLQMACMALGLLPIHTANLEAIKAMGRSDWFLRLEIIKQAIWLFLLVISVQIGMEAIAICEVIAGIIGSFVNAWPNRKLIQYSYGEQIRDVLPALVLSLVMAIVITLFGRVTEHEFAKLAIQILSGVMFYVVASVLLKIKSFYYILDIIVQLVGKIRRQKNKRQTY